MAAQPTKPKAELTVGTVVGIKGKNNAGKVVFVAVPVDDGGKTVYHVELLNGEVRHYTLADLDA